MVRLAQGKRDRFRFAEQELGRGAAFLFQADDADRTALFQFLKRSDFILMYTAVNIIRCGFTETCQ